MGVTPEGLAEVYPKLYHMADAESWPSIRKHGLLSTTALLDLFELRGKQRADIERCRRPGCVPINHAVHGRAVVRDQIPLIESKLAKALPCGYTPTQWYQLLNQHVFFWLTESRLQTLLCAKAYRGKAHAVLTIDTLPFVNRYADGIVLSPMNSGNTQPIAHKRDPAIFQKMSHYPFNERRKYGDYYRVVELAVRGGADVNGAVLSVDLMQCHESGVRVVKNIFRRK
jgi:hypothetical protein